ncbi:1-acyl-sn-glycerol-3-phosphate acyltransferase [Sungkyunkwania multivorans]|uniref:1-acyl-sn-glycerol-3-phosphate acyltransferase n=1 Tax=Sungkyunkwania multivorans TaxID=1173618 RepID=A0ABW3CY40_9FLAO
MRWLAKVIYHKLLGWKLIGTFPKVDKCLVIVVPHTHWMDFPIAALVRSIIKEEINFIGKKSLFRPPFGWYFRWMGGAPVNRSENQNKVQAIAQIFKEREKFRLALAPEGTRKKVDEWRTGFYFIAKEAEVPICMAALDFGKKEVKFSELFYPTDDMEADFKFMHQFYEGVVGKVPEYT